MTARPTDRPEVIDLVYEIQREFSRQTEPAGLARVFVEELARLLPVSRIVYAMPWPPPVRRFAADAGRQVGAGSLGFRVLLDLESSAVATADPGLFRGMFVPRAHDRADGRGGLLGSITGQARPVLRGDLSPGEAAGGLGAGAGRHRSVMAVPVFWMGEVQAWIVVFADEEDAFTSDDLRLLLSTGNTLVRSTVYLDGLEETRRANARVRETLARIGSAQRSMLPAAGAVDPRVRLSISYETCEESGGDHYDLREPESGVLEMVIADVSGHGALATVGVAMFRTALLAQRRTGRSCVEAVREIDALMRESLRADTFVTGVFISMDLATGETSMINRGHPPPIVRRADGRIEVLESGGGLPLGIADQPDGGAATHTLRAGDLLVLYSDGITEAFDPCGVQFGQGRLISAVVRGGGDGERTRAGVMRDVGEHEAGRPRADDQTLVLVSYAGS